jgi:hypothetical protein
MGCFRYLPYDGRRLNSGRYPRPQKPKAVREKSVILDARDLVKRCVIRADHRRGGPMHGLVAEASRLTLSGRYYVEAGDTLPLLTQSEPRHRMQLGFMRLEYTPHGGQPIVQEISLFAGLTRLEVIFWGFECPRCLRYARKVFLPQSRVHFACRTCHGLRYLSQEKIDAMQRECEADLFDKIPANPKMLRYLERAGHFLRPASRSGKGAAKLKRYLRNAGCFRTPFS